jgi:hypothetical protein
MFHQQGNNFSFWREVAGLPVVHRRGAITGQKKRTKSEVVVCLVYDAFVAISCQQATLCTMLPSAQSEAPASA